MNPSAINARRPFYCLSVFGLLCLSACAGEPVPTTQMAVARQAVEDAVQSGATERDPSDLVAAKEKLARADQAVSAGQNLEARRLAEEAQLDAQLAAARSRSAAAAAVLSQAQQSNATLQQETQHRNSSH